MMKGFKYHPLCLWMLPDLVTPIPSPAESESNPKHNQMLPKVFRGGKLFGFKISFTSQTLGCE